MPVQAVWLDETQQVLILRYQGRWSWSEHYRAVAAAHQMQDALVHNIGLVLDMSQSEGLPALPLEHLQGMSKLRHPRTVVKVMIGANNFLRSMVRIVERIFPQYRNGNFFVVETLQEAQTLIAARLAQSEV